MALSAAEQQELAQLEKTYGNTPPASMAAGGLSSQEQNELDRLEARYGQKPEASVGQTALEHGANAASFGYLPQLQALAQKPIYSALNAVTGKNVEPDNYVTARDQNIKRLSDEAQANPKTAMASEIGGGVLSAAATPTPEIAALKKLGLLGSVIKGAGVGTGYGLVQNPGDKPGEVNPTQLDERLANAERGAKVGGVAGGTADVVGRGLGLLANSADSAQSFANEKAFKGAGAMLKDFRSASAKGDVQKIGQFMRDNGLIKAGDTAEDVAEKAEALQKQAGGKLDDIYNLASEESAPASKQATEIPQVTKLAAGAENSAAPKVPFYRVQSGEIVVPNSVEKTINDTSDNVLKLPSKEPVQVTGFNPVRDKDKILSQVSEAMGNKEGKTAALNRLGAYFDQLAGDHGDSVLSPRATQDIKTEMDQVANWARNPLSKEPATEAAYKEARQILSNKINEDIDRAGSKAGNSNAGQELRDANREYGMSKQIRQMAEDRNNRESANRMFGLTDTIAGSAGGAAGTVAANAMGGSDARHMGEGAIVGGLLGAVGNKLSRTYGPGVQSAVAGAAEPALRYSAEPIGKFGQAVYSPDAVARGLIEQQLLKSKKTER